MTSAHRWGSVPVPYITPWSAETATSTPLTIRHGRLAYEREGPYDRHDGVLWVRVAYAQGAGRPYFPGIHAWRQRQAVMHDLCQICAEPAHLGGRFLFLLAARDGRPIQEGETTAVPPIHPACARQAVRHCPHLRTGWAAALVTGTPAWGVAGIRYAPGSLVALPGPDPKCPEELARVAYTDDAGLRWVLAAREVIELLDVEPVTDLDAIGQAGIG
ncbi:hypothetical protein [Streptomyces sp. NPDC090994]|uniref:hypothetical protein n=1 Tax=Streptomyces sp. NPDC090994 TaxID=3365969 RepID=UPI003810A168